jgi:hypothetical protein
LVEQNGLHDIASVVDAFVSHSIEHCVAYAPFDDNLAKAHNGKVL